MTQYRTAMMEKDRLQHQLLDEIAIEIERFHDQPTHVTSSIYCNEQRYKRIIEESSLIPFIESLLKSHTMLEMESHINTYQKVFYVRFSSWFIIISFI